MNLLKKFSHSSWPGNSSTVFSFVSLLNCLENIYRISEHRIPKWSIEFSKDYIRKHFFTIRYKSLLLIIIDKLHYPGDNQNGTNWLLYKEVTGNLSWFSTLSKVWCHREQPVYCNMRRGNCQFLLNEFYGIFLIVMSKYLKKWTKNNNWPKSYYCKKFPRLLQQIRSATLYSESSVI